MWRSLVARFTGGEEVAGSIPVIPTCETPTFIVFQEDFSFMFFWASVTGPLPVAKSAIAFAAILLSSLIKWA